MITCMDDMIGEILDELQDQGFYEIHTSSIHQIMENPWANTDFFLSTVLMKGLLGFPL